MSHYFVTSNTLATVAWQFAHAEKISMDKVWLQLAIKGLREFFSELEGKQLYTRRLLIESRLGLLVKEKKRFNTTEVFGSRAPRFHASRECTLMLSNYFNYEIPPQIQVLGGEKVREFQLYCEANRAELQRLAAANREDVFWARVGLRFGVTGINPQKIDKDNSGVDAVDEADIQQLESEISLLMDDLRQLEQDAEYGRMVSNCKYASSFTRALKISGLLDSDTEGLFQLRKLFDTKESIKRKLAAIYSHQAGVEVGLLPEEALIQAGIEPCRACCA